MTNLPTISPANIIQGKTTYSKPTIDQIALSEHVRNWTKTRKFWPQSLKEKLLTCSFQLIYIPHIVVYGHGTATWSSDVGNNETKRRNCRSCKGSGSITTYTTNYVTDGNNNFYPQNASQSRSCSSCHGRGYFETVITHWQTDSGTVNANYKGVAFLNSSNNLRIKCGERCFPKEQPVLSSNLQENIKIVTPSATQEHEIKAFGLAKLQEAVQSRLNNTRQSFDVVRNWQQSTKNIQEVRTSSYLYPMYFGVFSHKNREFQAQIDGITGMVFSEEPMAVTFRKTLLLSLVITAILLLIAAIIFSIYTY